MTKQLLSFITIFVLCCSYGTEADTSKTTSLETGQTPKPQNQDESQAGTSGNPKQSKHGTNSTINPVENQDEYINFPAVGIKLVRPDGFDDAENFYGFQQQDMQSSVMVVSIPGPFSEVTRGLYGQTI